MSGYRIAMFMLIALFAINFSLELRAAGIPMFDWIGFSYHPCLMASVVYILSELHKAQKARLEALQRATRNPNECGKKNP